MTRTVDQNIDAIAADLLCYYGVRQPHRASPIRHHLSKSLGRTVRAEHLGIGKVRRGFGMVTQQKKQIAMNLGESGHERERPAIVLDRPI